MAEEGRNKAEELPPPPLEPLPWHADALAGMQAEARGDRLPQTLLLCAPTGTGLTHFADVFTAWLLCDRQTESERACGNCRGCRQWLSRGHPDALTLLAQGAGQEIAVDAVREAIDSLSLARHYAGYRIVRLHPAEALNRSAANAFLKTLEEPAAGTIFLLLSEQPRNLPPTVRSRAQIRQLPMPDEASSRHWLEEQGCTETETALQQFPGQPLNALAQQDSANGALYEQVISNSVKNPSQLTDNAKKVSESRDAALAFLNWLATRQWQHARNSLQAEAAHTSDTDAANADVAVAGYRLALDARAAIKSYTQPQLAIEALLVSWRGLHVQSRKATPKQASTHE